MPKVTAYHLKISCHPYNTWIIRFVQFKMFFTKLTVQIQSHRRGWFSNLDEACVSIEVCDYQKLVHAQNSRRLLKQAYTVKVHAKKAQGLAMLLMHFIFSSYISDVATCIPLRSFLTYSYNVKGPHQWFCMVLPNESYSHTCYITANHFAKILLEQHILELFF